MILIDNGFDGQLIEISLGDTLELRLPENPVTGFRWHLQTSGEPILALVADSFEPGDGTPGKGGIHWWRFQTVRDGTAFVELSYRRKWEQSARSAQTFKLQVHATR
jgi:inhibitor of cysteine peptidase